MAQLPTGNGANILGALANLAPIFIGSGKQTKTATTGGTVTKSADSSAIEALRSVLNSQAANPGAAKDVVKDAQKNVIQLMLQAGVPSIGAAERGAGIYNSSQTSQAMSQLEGQTAAAAAKLEVDQVNQAAQTATQASSALGQMTATSTESGKVTEVTKADPAINPLYSALGLALGVGLANKDSIFSLFGGDNPTRKREGSVLDIGNAMSSLPSSPVLEKPVNSVLEAFSNIGFDSLINNIAGDLKSSTFDPSTGGQRTGGIDEFVGAAESNIISQGLSSLFSLFTGGSNSSSSGSSGGSSGSTFGTVICTRMHELGYMDKATYRADCMFGDMLRIVKPEFHAWYLSWATSFAASLQLGTLRTWAVWQLVRPLSEYMQFVVGDRVRNNHFGELIFNAGYIAFRISSFLSGVRNGKHTRRTA